MDEQVARDLSEQLARLTQLLESLEGARAGSSASDILLSLVPLLGVVFGATLLFFFLLWQYRLRKELIRVGRTAPEFMVNIRLISLLVGLLGVFAGVPLTALFYAIDGLSYALLGGVLPLFAGVGLLLFYAMTRPEQSQS